MIEWGEFSWEAFATLATGLSAVAAAFIVASQQLRIIRQQVFLQELAFRNDVFDRRLHVYRAVRKYIQYLLDPDRTEVISGEVCEAFFDAEDISRFLFSRDLEVRLSLLSDLAFKVVTLRGEIAERSISISDEEITITQQLSEATERLRDDFLAIRKRFEQEIRITAMKNPPKRRHFDPESPMTFEEAQRVLKAGLETY